MVSSTITIPISAISMSDTEGERPPGFVFPLAAALPVFAAFLAAAAPDLFPDAVVLEAAGLGDLDPALAAAFGALAVFAFLDLAAAVGSFAGVRGGSGRLLAVAAAPFLDLAGGLESDGVTADAAADDLLPAVASFLDMKVEKREFSRVLNLASFAVRANGAASTKRRAKMRAVLAG